MEEEKNYPYKKIVTVMLSIEKEDGSYSVDYKVVQSRSVDGEQWEAREASTTGYGRTKEKAFDVAASEMLFYLNAVNGDFFSEKELEKWNQKAM